MIFMIKRFLILATGSMILLMATTACKKDKKDDYGDASVIIATNIIGDNDSEVAQVKAISPLFDYYDGFYELVGEYEAVPVPYNNHGFKINLPITLPDKCFMVIGNEGFPEGIFVSDKNAKIAYGGCGAYDKYGKMVGGFSLKYEKGENEFCTAVWIYCDRNLVIQGRLHDEDEYYEYRWEYDSDLNYHLKKGWNIVYMYSKIHQTEYSYSHSVKGTTEKPSGIDLRWYYINDSYYDKSSLPKDKTFSIFNILKFNNL